MENQNFDDLDSIINAPLPGIPTDVKTGQIYGWNEASLENLSAIPDGATVLVQKDGQQRQMKWSRRTRKFQSMEPYSGPRTLSGAPAKMTPSLMPVDPSDVQGFAAGESEMQTFANEALRATPTALTGGAAFMGGLALGGGPTTPSGWGLGIAASIAAGAATDAVMTHGLKMSPSDQDMINSQLNPLSSKLGSFSPNLLLFRPSARTLKAGAGFAVPGMTQAQALKTMGHGGLVNLAISQASSTASAATVGVPGTDNLTAAVRSLGWGDPTQEDGGSIGDRLAHAGTEFGLGAGVFHKTWGLGAKIHNKVHGRADQVKLSGNPTEDALSEQRRNLEDQLLLQRTLEIAKSEANDKVTQAAEVPLTSTQDAGIKQIKATLAKGLETGRISQEAHDNAQIIADTLGAEMLKNIQLRQIGGSRIDPKTGKPSASVEGEAAEAELGDTKGFTNAVYVFAKAIERGRFTPTLSHEIFHPLFDSLSPKMRQRLLGDLAKERQRVRAIDKAFDEVLKFAGADNAGDWLPLAERTFTNEEALAVINHLERAGIKDAKAEFNRLFTVQGEGKFRLRNEMRDDDGKISRRLWTVREFLSVESARLIQNRGEYDKRWGVTDKHALNFMRVWYETMKGALQRISKTRGATDEILDRITSGTLKKLMAEGSDGVIPSRASSTEVIRNTEAEVGSKPISLEKTESGLGDILKSDQFKADIEKKKAELKKAIDEQMEMRRNRISGAAVKTGTQQLSEERKPGQAVSERDAVSQVTADAQEQIQAERDAGKSETFKEFRERNLSEGDADPSLPETSKEALKKLGIKNTVIGNVVRHSKIGSIRSEFDKASTAGEVAHIFRNTSQATQESIQVLVTDKDGNPLEIYRHTLSEPGSSTLLPSVMIAQALSVKGAKRVWVSHNHPSMTPQFSGSDLTTELNIRTMFQGTGLTMEGFLAIAGDKYAFIGKESKGRDLDRQDIPGSRFPATGREVPIIERRFTLPRGEDTDVVSTTKGDTDVNQRMLVQELLGGKPGVIFLDRNDRAVGHQEVTAEKMAKLGIAGARNLLAGFSRSGGTSIVVHVGGDTVADALQIRAGENVANMGASVRGAGATFIKNIIGTNPLVRTLDSKGSRVSGFKSEGDAPFYWEAFDRGEPETRVGVGAIKPLHAAPKSNFPIMADKLKDFGFESGYLNQFSEHAIVGQLKTGVTQVRTAGDVASLIHDYSSTLAQGQTMILIIGADGKPIQVGLHMVDSTMNVQDKVVIKPMWGVLAGQAVSTPGAKEAWMVRINNDVIPGEVDASVQNEIALKNLLEGSGINYRGLVAVAGRQYRSIEYTPGVQNKNGGHNQFDSTNVDWMPIDVRPATSTIPLTERRYSTRSQMPYDKGVTAPDRPIGAEDAGWNRNENASAKRLREHLGGDPGVVFKTSSGKIVGTVHLTLDEMANIRNSPAQKTLLAMMDRAGVNWGMVSVGDAPNDPVAARATSNINAFLKQMGLKVTDTFHNNLGIVPGDPVGTSEYRWQSEGDAEVPLHRRDLRKDTPEWRQAEQDTKGLAGVSSDEGDMGAYGRRNPTIGSKDPAVSGQFDTVEARVNNLQSKDLVMDDSTLVRHILAERQKRDSNGKVIPGRTTNHLHDFIDAGIDLGGTRGEQLENLKNLITSAFDNREGVARIGQGFGNGIRSSEPNDTRVTILSTFQNVHVQVILEAGPDGNRVITAFPVRRSDVNNIRNHPTFIPSKGVTDKIDFERSKPLRQLQAKAGMPENNIRGPRGADVRSLAPDLVDKNSPKVKGTYGEERPERKRGMLNNTAFSEGDAQEYNGRAEEAFKRDQIVGPEAIKGDFLAWMKSTKEMADQHLYQLPWPGNGERGTWEEDNAFNDGRKAQHATIDQVLAKLTKQKGFNPMTLKPGMLRQVGRIANEATLGAFKELTRVASNMHEFVLDQPADIDMDAEWKNLQKWHASIIKQTQLGMEAGVISKASGLEIIEMTNDVRSRSFSAWYEYRKENGGDLTNFSEGDAENFPFQIPRHGEDAENMRIPGGARDEALKRRPARMNKTYLNIGHGADHGERHAGDGPRPPFNPEKVFLYHYESESGKLTARNIAEMADAEGIEREDVKPDSFVHGDQGELGIDTGVGIKRGGSGVNGRIEIDDGRKVIFVSAGSSRGELNNFRKGDAGKMRAEALSQVRKYVETMQEKGQLPKGYKVEGYGFDQNRSVWENQERFSEGDAQETRSFREPNHKDETLTKNGFITNYADDKFIRGAQRDQLVLELRREYGTKTKVFDPSVLKQGTGRSVGSWYRLDITDKGTGREYGHITFTMESETSAYVVSTLVRGVHENKGVAKVMYAELGERLRRAGVTELTGMVVDEYVDPKTGKVIHRPIAAREAVFGLGSTEVNHRYDTNTRGDNEWMHADVRTKIDPARRLSEGDAEPAMPPDTNPRTSGNELANHTNVQLAKRGFISNYAHSKLKSLAGMKIRIGLQTDGTKPTTPITEGMELDMGKEENTFQGKVEYTGENGLIEIAQFTYVIKNHGNMNSTGHKFVPSEDYSSALDWIKIKPQFRGRDLSNVITAEIAERLKRLKTGSITAFVVDPEGRPIKALQRILGDENVIVEDHGLEETDGRDPFRMANHNSGTGFVRRARDVEGTIDPKKLYSEGDDGENMRIPGGFRDEALKRRPKAPKPIKFWTDVGHADGRDAEGEKNTFLWYSTKDGEIDVISADELRMFTDTASDDIPTHLDWETHMDYGNFKGKHGKQPITSLPHGRIDNRDDVTRVSYLDHKNSGRTDYEFLRDEIKNKLAGFMLKQANEMPGYDFTKGLPERFSEGDSENMRIPGGFRDEALKKREAALRQKRFRKEDFDLLYTDIGHPEGFGTSGKIDTVDSSDNQFLWSYDRYGQFHMQSVRDAVEAFNESRLKKYNRLLAEGEAESSVSDLKTPVSEEEFTHNEWAKALGLKSAMELDYKTGNGRLDITADGKVRMSWVAKIEEVRERQMMAEQIKEEAASWLNSNKSRIKVPVTSQVKMPFRGTEADKIVGWNWGKGSDDATGRPRRFSEGDEPGYHTGGFSYDAENGKWPNQNRAKSRIPDVMVRNGETDLGFVLDPGEVLDSKGLRIRKNTAGRMFWGDIGHDPEFFMADKAVIDALGKTLPDNFDAAAGLFAFNAKTGRVETTQDRIFTSHLDWLSPNSNFGDPGFGKIPNNYSLMGRFEPAILGTDGVVIRRGRISLARNVADGNWVFDTADFSRSDIPAGGLAKVREAIAEESNAILDGKNRAKFEPAQDTAADHYDVFGFGMAKEKENMGFSPKDTGPIKLNEDAKTYRDLADRPIGEGKDGQARLLKIGRQLSEGDAVEETPFRIPKTAGNRTNMQLAKDIATARFFTGISTKAHENAAEFPLSKTMKEIANLVHARAGAEAGVTGLDLPTAIMKERTKQMNRFFEIMDPLRSEFAAMDRDGREQAYQEMADMVTGLRSIDSSTSAGRAAEGIKAMLKEMHDYRTGAGEKLGEVEDYFPAVYDSINISENAMAFKEDAKQAYMIELKDAFQGDALEAAAEKAARELTMSHIRGEGEGTFNDLFESDAPAMGENSSMKRKFGPESQRIMSKWQIKDPYRIISRYIAGATKRAELTRRLGDEGQQWRRMAQALEKEGVSYEKIDEMRDLLKASVGVGLRQNTRGEQTFIDLMGLYTAGSVMGRSFLNNMFEPASMGIRSGNLSLGLQAYGQTWARTIRNAGRVLSGERIDKTFWEQYAEHVGTISADVNDAWMNSHSIEVDGDRSDPRINWLTSKVYQSNLLQITENAKLQASHAIGFKYLTGLAEMHQGKSFMNKFDVTESVRSNLRELGIPDADHTQFAQWMTRLSSLNDAGRMRMLTSGGKMSKMFETAITKFSLQSSIRSNRAHKPVFQDGPIGKTLFQLMSYSYSYAAEVNSRTYSYAKSALKSAPAGKSYAVGDRIRFMAPLMMAPLGIIAYRALFALKDELYPTEFSEKHENDPAWTKWLNATSYAGAFGPKVEMATKYVMRDQPPGGPLGQTVVGAARAAKTAVVNAVEGKPQDNAIRQAKKASVSPIKAATVIGATAVHPAAGTIASQVANSTSWSNAMTGSDKKSADKDEYEETYPYNKKKKQK